MERKTKQVLERTFELIEDPAHWHQGTNYRNAKGGPCPQSEAVSFCLLGAFETACVEVYGSIPPIGAADAIDWFELERKDLAELRNQLGRKDVISSWNDSHTHEEVLGVVRGAIEAQ